MKVIKGNIPGLVLLEPNIYRDERGRFFESFNQLLFNQAIGKEITFLQDNESVSKENVIRGLHFQEPPFGQGKLVRVTKGRVLDIAVDIRNGSPTYGHHQLVELSEENGLQFWIPEGFAHGFVALEEDTKFQYKCTNVYNKGAEVCIKWDDPTLGIDWTIPDGIISEKDQQGISFASYESPFVYE